MGACRPKYVLFPSSQIHMEPLLLFYHDCAFLTFRRFNIVCDFPLIDMERVYSPDHRAELYKQQLGLCNLPTLQTLIRCQRDSSQLRAGGTSVSIAGTLYLTQMRAQAWIDLG